MIGKYKESKEMEFNEIIDFTTKEITKWLINFVSIN